MRDVEQILLSLQSTVALTREERKGLRARIAEAMRAQAVTFSPATRLLSQESEKAPLSGLFQGLITGLTNNYRMPALAIALILALSGGGVAYAAQGALPGDLLYPVKVGVDENVQQALAFSDQAKADVNASLAAERLKEAALLAAKSGLSTTTRATLEENLSAHLAAVSTHLAKLSEKGDVKAVADVDSKLESSLSAYADAFASLQGNAAIGTTTQDQVANFLENVKKHENDVHESSVSAFAALEGSDATTTAAELSAEHTLAMTTLTKAQAAFANASTTLAVGVSASASAHIADATNQLATGDTQAASGNNVSAYASYQNSIRSSLMALAEIGVQSAIGGALREREDESAAESQDQNQKEDMSSTSPEQEHPSSEGEGHHATSSTEDQSNDQGGASADVHASVNTDVNAGVNVKVDASGEGSSHGIGNLLGGDH